MCFWMYQTGSHRPKTSSEEKTTDGAVLGGRPLRSSWIVAELLPGPANMIFARALEDLQASRSHGPPDLACSNVSCRQWGNLITLALLATAAPEQAQALNIPPPSFLLFSTIEPRTIVWKTDHKYNLAGFLVEYLDGTLHVLRGDESCPDTALISAAVFRRETTATPIVPLVEPARAIRKADVLSTDYENYKNQLARREVGIPQEHDIARLQFLSAVSNGYLGMHPFPVESPVWGSLSAGAMAMLLSWSADPFTFSIDTWIANGAMVVQNAQTELLRHSQPARHQPYIRWLELSDPFRSFVSYIAKFPADAPWALTWLNRMGLSRRAVLAAIRDSGAAVDAAGLVDLIPKRNHKKTVKGVLWIPYGGTSTRGTLQRFFEDFKRRPARLSNFAGLHLSARWIVADVSGREVRVVGKREPVYVGDLEEVMLAALRPGAINSGPGVAYPAWTLPWETVLVVDAVRQIIQNGLTERQGEFLGGEFDSTLNNRMAACVDADLAEEDIAPPAAAVTWMRLNGAWGSEAGDAHHQEMSWLSAPLSVRIPSSSASRMDINRGQGEPPVDPVSKFLGAHLDLWPFGPSLTEEDRHTLRLSRLLRTMSPLLLVTWGGRVTEITTSGRLEEVWSGLTKEEQLHYQRADVASKAEWLQTLPDRVNRKGKPYKQGTLHLVRFGPGPDDWAWNLVVFYGGSRKYEPQLASLMHQLQVLAYSRRNLMVDAACETLQELRDTDNETYTSRLDLLQKIKKRAEEKEEAYGLAAALEVARRAYKEDDNDNDNDNDDDNDNDHDDHDNESDNDNDDDDDDDEDDEDDEDEDDDDVNEREWGSSFCFRGAQQSPERIEQLEELRAERVQWVAENSVCLWSLEWLLVNAGFTHMDHAFAAWFSIQPEVIVPCNLKLRWFSTKIGKEEHELRCTGKCDRCQMTVANRRQHWREECEAAHQCKRCNRGFATKRGKEKHELRCTGKCDLCDKTTVNIRQHWREEVFDQKRDGGARPLRQRSAQATNSPPNGPPKRLPKRLPKKGLPTGLPKMSRVDHPSVAGAQTSSAQRVYSEGTKKLR
ncbi:hypothetical protein B0H14DRAFT_3618308 [Mycena olivaceomarginata]|nr:hypothetical protein B0H14DRAFT_3618308 [Mycena olivaceomarginata]